ncbi:MAG: proton-conducting transporter membrane subunit [Acidilobaceae archaeon]
MQSPALEIAVALAASLLVAPAYLYVKLLGWRAGRLAAPAGFALLSLYALLYLEDPFQRALAAVAGIECAIVSLYTLEYAEAKYAKYSESAPGILYTLTNIFGLTIVLFLASGTVVGFAALFALAGLVGFLLVAFDSFFGASREAWSAAVRYLAASMVPSDIAALSLAGLALAQGAGFTSPTRLELAIEPLVLALILLGFLAKAAVAPLHFWIADAHSAAPAPASAILSGLMVKMGVYGIYVVFKASDSPQSIAVSVAVLASLTTIYGGLAALLQDDMKRLLAYSTMSNTSAMAMLAALGEAVEISPASVLAVYAVAHSVFKSSLFLDSGFVELVFGTRSISQVRGVARASLLESAATTLSVLSLIGTPPTLGFLYKLLMFTYIAGGLNDSSLAALVLAVVALKIALSAGYGLKYIMPHVARSEETLSAGKAESLVRYTTASSLLNIAGLAIVLIATTEPSI